MNLKTLINKLRYKKIDFKEKWRQINSHNFLSIENEFNFSIVSVGKETYGSMRVISYGSAGERLTIGNYVSMALNTTFFLSSGHDLNKFTTFPFNVFYCNCAYETPTKGEIIVQDDVWIGDKVTILPGVTLGQGCVIALGSVVTKNVPPYAVVGGVPARVIKYRFPANIIKKLVKIDFSKLDKHLFVQHKDLFNQKCSEQNIDEILKYLPQKIS